MAQLRRGLLCVMLAAAAVVAVGVAAGVGGGFGSSVTGMTTSPVAAPGYAGDWIGTLTGKAIDGVLGNKTPLPCCQAIDFSVDAGIVNNTYQATGRVAGDGSATFTVSQTRLTKEEFTLSFSCSFPVQFESSGTAQSVGTIQCGQPYGEFTGTFHAVRVRAFDMSTCAAGTKPTSTPSTTSTTPAENGLIAFSSNRSGDFDIYTVAGDGTGLKRLTTCPLQETDPAWSPDGSRIAYVRYATCQEANCSLDLVNGSVIAGVGAIFVMNADGSHVTKLTKDASGVNDPTWSPDGSQIAYSAGKIIGSVHVMNADGSHVRRIATGTQPAWSPDGKSLLISTGFGGDIGRVPATGGRITIEVKGSQDGAVNPAWSPDGTRFAYSLENGRYRYVLYTADANGANRSALATGGENLQPAWSPDGKLLAFSRGGNQAATLWTVRADGSGLKQITPRGPYEDSWPSWQRK